MPHYVVMRTMEALNDHGRALKGAKILVLGLAYKKDVDDVRESPAFEVIELLQHKGASVTYHDPFVPKTHTMRQYDLRDGLGTADARDASGLRRGGDRDGPFLRRLCDGGRTRPAHCRHAQRHAGGPPGP